MNAWIEWYGEDSLPVAVGTFVDVRYRDGEERYNVPVGQNVVSFNRDAGRAFWENDGVGNDIVAYRVHKKNTHTKIPNVWYEHDGSAQPVADDARVVVWLAGGQPHSEWISDIVEAKTVFWRYTPPACAGDVIRYCIVNDATQTVRIPPQYMASSASDSQRAVYEAHEKIVDNLQPGQQEEGSVASDGGSSSYYNLTITNKDGEAISCVVGDIIRAMVGNDFDLGNIVKACRRMYEASQGRGKDGASIAYDANKVKYFADQFTLYNKQ